MCIVGQVTGTELYFTPQCAHFFLPTAPSTSLSWSLQQRHSPQTTTSFRVLERAAVPRRAARSERPAVRALETFSSSRPPIGACCIAGTRRVHCPIFCVNEEFYFLAGGSTCSTAKCNGRCRLQAGQTDGQHQRHWILRPAKNFQFVPVCMVETCPPLNLSPADTGSEWWSNERAAWQQTVQRFRWENGDGDHSGRYSDTALTVKKFAKAMEFLNQGKIGQMCCVRN
jgi:hypothetical protein